MALILDPKDTMKNISDGVMNSLKSFFPYKGKSHELILTNTYPGDQELDIDDISGQRSAKLYGKTWSMPIYGDFELKDNETGKTLDKKAKIKLINLPNITRRFSFIVDGNEYQVENQWRLKAGVYSREKANGELETQFNLAKGRGFAMLFDPKRKLFFMKYGSSNIKMYPVMKALGVNDDEIKKMWGEEIYAINKAQSKDAELFKLLKSISRVNTTSLDEATIAINEEYNKTSLREDTTAITLGKAVSKVNAEALTLASTKLLNIHRGKDEVDNRDDLEFKELWSIDDFLTERLLNSKKRIITKLGNNVDRKDEIRSIVNTEIFNTPIKAFFTNPTGVTDRPTQVNPLSMLSGHLKTTVLGTGGISSTNAVSFDAKLIQPSHLGFLDPIVTPESDKAGISLHLSLGTSKIGKEPAIRLYNVKSKQFEYKTPAELSGKNIAFPDQVTWKGDVPTPIKKNITVSNNKEGDPQVKKWDEVDYIIQSSKGMFSLTSNFVPFLPSTQPNRAEMASRHLEQAIPLVNREAPLVQNYSVTGSTPKTADLDTWEKRIGNQSSFRSPVDGVVESISKSYIKIRDKDKKLHTIDIYNNFPLNDPKAFISSDVQVKVGDKVEEDQLIADTNFTKNGILALGTNLRIGYLPYKGLVFEDGIVISESASKKMTSEHLLKERAYLEKNMSTGKSKFRTNFPGTITDENADKLDDDGVVKPGQIVHPGEIIATIMQKTEPNKEQLMLKGIHKALVRPYRDKSLTWDSSVPGVVTDVIKNGKEITVLVKTQEQADIGDKFSNRFGGKGVCCDKYTELLTNSGWKYFYELNPEDLVCTLNPITEQIEYQKPTNYIAYHYTGDMYHYNSRRLKIMATPDHNHYVRKLRNKNDYSLENSKSIFGSVRVFKRTGNWVGEEIETITIPSLDLKSNGNHKFDYSKDLIFKMDDFIEFFGWYITEGSTDQGKIYISQRKSVNPIEYDLIVDNIRRLGYEPSLYDDGIYFTDKRLAVYLQQFGADCKVKFIPQEFLSLSKRQLNILFTTCLLGDGGEYLLPGKTLIRKELYTDSKLLADNYQELILKIGYSASISANHRRKTYINKYSESHDYDTTEYVVRLSHKPEVFKNNDKRYDSVVEEWVHYDDMVYCVEVPNHIIYVRREGVPVWTGNCTAIIPDEEMPRDAEGNALEIIVNPCYDELTEVLTIDGWKYFYDVKVGDIVMSMDPDTQEARYETVELYHEYDHDGLMYRIQNNKIDLFVTPNHKMYTKACNNKKAKYQISDTTEIFGKRRHYIKAPKSWNGVTPETITIADCNNRDGNLGPNAKEELLTIDSTSFARFIGLFLAEGWTYFNTDNYAYQIGVCQSITAKPENVKLIDNLMLKLPWHIHRRERNNGMIEWTLQNKELYTWLVNNCGKGAINKRIPREMLSWGKDALQELFNWMMLGDGSIKNNPKTGHYNTVRYFTNSKALADNVQELVLRLGMTTTITEDNHRGNTNYVMSISKNITPSVNWSTETQKHQVEQYEPYIGKVYCLTVPSGLLFVRRNSIITISCNSGVPGRINPSQVLEASLGKVAKATGQFYAINSFEPNSAKKIVKVAGHYRTVNTKEGPKKVWIDEYEYEKGFQELVAEELKANNISETTELFDPETGKSLGPILVGDAYFLKLMHQVEKKLSARAHGYGYDYDSSMIPKGGGDGGAQRFGSLGFFSLLAHGATANLHDGLIYKCFPYHEKVLTDQGEIEIGKIVNSNLPVKVLSKNVLNGNLEYKEIENYWSRPFKDSNLYEVVSYRGLNNKSFRRAKMVGTDTHTIFTNNGKKYIKDLDTTNDKLLTTGYSLSYNQRQILIGSLLGDGYLAKKSNCQFAYYQERHCIKQRDYLQFKANSLKSFSNRKLRIYDPGNKGFNCNNEMVEWSTRAHPELSELHSLFYKNNKKIFSKDVFDGLDLLGLAVWFQDDGSCCISSNGPGPNLSIAVHPLTNEEKEIAINRIEELTGVKFNINGGYIRKYGTEAIKFLEKVAPYIHPSMSYKLCGYGNVGTQLLEVERFENNLCSIEVPILSLKFIGNIQNLTYSKYTGSKLFNLNIKDNHNYFVRGLQVGNSDASNDEVWTAIQAGEPLPAPKIPFAFQKFVSYLNALGLNVEKEGNELKLLPFTDAQILELSNGALINASKLLRGKDLKPEKGGLFDEDITGGPGGKNFSHITLFDRVPSPMFEKALISLLGVTGVEYDEILSGKKGFDENFKLTSAEKATHIGFSGIKKYLDQIDVKKEIEETRERIKSGRKSDLNKSVKKLKFLSALDKNGLKPSEVYMTKYLPVLPPIMRPISIMEGGDLNVDGLNELYKNIAILNDKLSEAAQFLPETELVGYQKSIYGGLAALAGTTSDEVSITTMEGTKISPKGILTNIAGKDTPKNGYFQDKIVDRKQDLSARSVIIPDMTLHLDELGLPRVAAKEIFRPFVVKELVRMGFTPLQARAEIEKDTNLANKALDVVVGQRPVLFKRDPVLHKFGILGFKARLHDGSAIKIHPLVTGGFGADFDGDAMSVFVPVSQEAVDEAYRMMPSKNLFNPATGKVMYQPTLEGQLGIYLLSIFGDKTDKKYTSQEDAIKDARSGAIAMTDQIDVGGMNTTAGRLFINNTLPKELRSDSNLTDPNFILDAKGLQKLMQEMAVKSPSSFAPTIDAIKELGFGHAYNIGFSFKLDDFTTLKNIRNKHLEEADAKIAKLSFKNRAEKNKKIIEIYTQTNIDINKEASEYLKKTNNKLYTMSKAGVKPGWVQIQQLILSPMLLQNAKNETIPVPVKNSYSEGLDVSGYWVSSSGARKGLIEKVQSVQKPGALSKQILNTTMSYVVTKDDCGTTDGISLDISDSNVLDRFTASPVKIGGKSIPAGELVTTNMLSDLNKAGIKSLKVRSPLKCVLPAGMCATCFGAQEDGKKLKINTNIGILAGQAIGERAVQISMKQFHKGGVAEKVSSGSALDRLTQLLKMPEKLANSAILSPKNNTVKSITASTAGGWDIEIGDEEVYVPSSRTLRVKKGDKVNSGQPLTDGDINPIELLEYTDMPTVQKYLSDEMYEVYKSEGVKRRNIEVITKAITNLGVITSSNADEYIKGDYIPLSFANKLKQEGKDIKFRPVLRGIETLALDQSTDWIARLQYRRLKETLINGSNEMWKSDIHGLHPIPGLAYAAEFGKKKDDSDGPY